MGDTYTCEEKCEEDTTECVRFLPRRRAQILSATIATIGSFGLGTVFGWSAPALPLLSESGDFGALTENQKSYIASFALFGALFSPPSAAFLMNRIGRKLAMFTFALPFTLGWLLIAFANSISMLYVGRFVTGFSGAAFTTIIPVYIGEIADKKIRGALSTMMILMLVTGVLFSFAVGALVTWQALSFCCLVVPLVVVALLPFLPETPRYYVSRSKMEEATASLVYLRGAKNASQVQRALATIKSNYQQDVEDSSSWRDLFVPSSIKPICMSLTLIFFQQMCGANAVSFRQVEVVESAGTGLNANVASIIIAATQVVLVLVPTFTVDRIGRKVLMLASEAIMVLGLLGLAVYFHLKEQDASAVEGMGWLALTSLLVFTIGYNVGMGPIPFVVSAELLPSQSRSLSTAVVIEFYYILSTLTTLFFGNVTEKLGWTLSYGGFGLVCVAGAIFILFVIPETKGRSAEQIELLFKRKSTVRRVSIRRLSQKSIASASGHHAIGPNGSTDYGSGSLTPVNMDNVDMEEEAGQTAAANGQQNGKRHVTVSVSGVDNPAFQE